MCKKNMFPLSITLNMWTYLHNIKHIYGKQCPFYKQVMHKNENI